MRPARGLPFAGSRPFSAGLYSFVSGMVLFSVTNMFAEDFIPNLQRARRLFTRWGQRAVEQWEEGGEQELIQNQSLFRILKREEEKEGDVPLAPCPARSQRRP